MTLPTKSMWRISLSIGMRLTSRIPVCLIWLFCFSESSASWLHPWLPNSQLTFHDKFSERQLTNGHKNRKGPGYIRGSDPAIFVLKPQDSYRLTDFMVSWCNHRIVNVLWIWIFLPRRLPQQDLNTLWIRAVLSIFLFVQSVYAHTCCSRVYSQFWVQAVFSMREQAMKPQ